MTNETESISDAGLDLAVRLMEQNAKDLAHVTNHLLDTYKSERDAAQATILAIRDEIASLLAGKYMPTPNAIIDATYPTDETIQHYIDTYY